MSIIKANIIEVEVQEQAAPDAGAKYMMVVRYESVGKEQSDDILKIFLTNKKPIIKQTIDFGDKVIEKILPSITKPKPIKTPEALFGLEESE